MTHSATQLPVIEYTMDLVRQVHLLNARETLFELGEKILMVKDLAALKMKFPAEATHFFDNFKALPDHPGVTILHCEFSDCDRDLPWGKVPGATAIYGASTDNEAEIDGGSDDLTEDEENDDDYVAEEATYVETGCWLLNPNLALIACVRMGPYEDETHNATGELEIVHSWDRKALRAFLESRTAHYPDQVEDAKTALDQVFGASDGSAPSRALVAARP